MGDTSSVVKPELPAPFGTEIKYTLPSTCTVHMERAGLPTPPPETLVTLRSALQLTASLNQGNTAFRALLKNKKIKSPSKLMGHVLS